MSLQKLTAAILDKVWGAQDTQPWLANPEGRKVGEIWFSAPEVLPVLVKFLFTTERLSVQVHPGDSYGQAHGGERGKTEMWHILRADPDAKIALGLREPVTKEVLRTSALNGEIVNLLRWITVQAGDTFFVPAGTIHAIGGGLVLCEIQQFSDVTYRLFDYGRKPARPLHLDDALAVARLEPADGRCGVTPYAVGRDVLADCEYFHTARVSICGRALCSSSPQPAIYLAIAGEGTLAGEPFRAGEAWLIPAGEPAFSIDSADAVFVIASGGG